VPWVRVLRRISSNIRFGEEEDDGYLEKIGLRNMELGQNENVEMKDEGCEDDARFCIVPLGGTVVEYTQ